MAARRLALALLAMAFAGCGATDDRPEGGDEAVDPDLGAEERGEAEGGRPAAELALEAYAEILDTFVDEKGLVHYVALRTHEDRLARFVDSFAKVDTATYDAWPDPKKIAFWINAYNALVLQTIVTHHPIEPHGLLDRFRLPDDSIRQVDGAFDGVEHRVLDMSLTLDEIRDDILRARFNDPRVLIALVDGARSSPPLLAEPYLGERLEAQLASQVERFLKDPERGVTVDEAEKVVRISHLFERYQEDFARGFQTDRFASRDAAMQPVLEFIATWREDLAGVLDDDEYEIEFLEFDWSQNDA